MELVALHAHGGAEGRSKFDRWQAVAAALPLQTQFLGQGVAAACAAARPLPRAAARTLPPRLLPALPTFLCRPAASRREDLTHRLHEQQAAARAPPAAAPTAQAAAEAAAEFGAAGEAAPGEGTGGSGGGASGPGRLRRHHVPPPAGPAAAAEPAVAPNMPSVPSEERTGAATRGGAGMGAAAHGFAAAVPADVAAELGPTAPLPQASDLLVCGWDLFYCESEA